MPSSIEEILAQLTRLQEQAEDRRTGRELGEIHKKLESHRQEQEAERNKLLDALKHDQATIAQLQAANVGLQTQNAEHRRTIEDLRSRLEQEAPATTTTPVDLAKSFRDVIDTIQTEARGASDVGVTIKSMDIEVKGLVQAQEGTTSLVLPTLKTPIDPSSLSTLRISFGAIPIVPSEEHEAEPEKAPRPRRARR